jgi:hypothetical protein
VNFPYVSREEDGTLVVEEIAAPLAAVLPELPALLAPDQPDAVRRRLFPDPSDDEEVSAEWRMKQHPELFALLADARRIVETDLASMRLYPDKTAWRLDIPPTHVHAWISALNAARLALGAREGITADDMAGLADYTRDRRGLTVLRIELFGILQAALLEATGQV